MRPVIKLDCDGVLLDIMTPWLEVTNAITGTNLHYEDINRWNWQELVPSRWRAYVHKFRFPWLYDIAKPLPGAVEGVRELSKAGFRLVVVTHDGPSHLHHKVKALRRHFPDIRHIVFAKNKANAVPTGYLVDDAPHNDPDVLLTQPWNRGAEYPKGRADNWAEVLFTLGVVPRRGMCDGSK